MKFQCIKNVDRIKILFKAIYIYIYIYIYILVIVMGGPAVSHSPRAHWGLNAALNRDGGANMVLYNSLKNLHDYWCKGNRTIVIQARGFIVLRHTDDDRFFLTGEGTTEVARDSVKIEVNKPVLRLPDCSNLKNTTKASTKNRHARWGNRTV